MTPRQLNVRLALLLGLPLAPACKEAPPAESPRAPVDIKPLASAASNVTDAGASARAKADAPLRCALDEVHEFVCGRIDDEATDAKVGAAPPFAACTVDARGLGEFDDFLFIDSGRVGRREPTLATFSYDAKRTASYHYRGTIREEDTFCCYERCTPLPIPKAPRGAVPPGLFVQEKCVPAPERGPSKPAKGAATCPEAVRLAIDTRENPGPFDDAPFAHVGDGPSDACCYSVATPRRCPTDMYESGGECKHPTRGRPLRDGATCVTAPAIARADFRDPVRLSLAAIDADTRDAAARAWTREGAAEHASVAAFARLTLDLMSVAAPAGLLDDVCRAARDEVRHATLAYGIASAFAGQPVGPGALALPSDARRVTLATLARECFRDGCVEETVAAMCAAEAQRESGVTEIGDALAIITADETRHAELAYRILAWALDTDSDGAARRAVEAELAAVVRENENERRAAGALPVAAPYALTALGILSPEHTALVRARVIDEVVVPTVTALLGRTRARARDDGRSVAPLATEEA